ncbi:MAG TPA: methylated-DNA--[protein]-cysteine S-methyltransferase [Patescibacteria group bacterium]|nr:methylated-DNA--[protein]-cysteine S-methyltransferase [Patescibacteria group bacterium]
MHGSLHYTRISTEFGEIILIWRTHEFKVKRILIPPHSGLLETAYPSATEATTPEISSLVEEVTLFLRGEPVEFKLDLLDFNLCSEFQMEVLKAEHGIPRGWVSTYGRIARHLGRNEGARAVGRALATNPFPLLIPCHREVRGNGELGGFQGGVAMKRRLLEMEGIEMMGNRVRMRRVFY